MERKIPQEEKTEILVSGSPRQNFGEVSNRRERWKEEEDSLYLCCGFHFSLAKLLTAATTAAAAGGGEKEEEEIGDKDSVLRLLGAAPRARNLEEEEEDIVVGLSFTAVYGASLIIARLCRKGEKGILPFPQNSHEFHEGTKKRFDVGRWLGQKKGKELGRK